MQREHWRGNVSKMNRAWYLQAFSVTYHTLPVGGPQRVSGFSRFWIQLRATAREPERVRGGKTQLPKMETRVNRWWKQTREVHATGDYCHSAYHIRSEIFRSTRSPNFCAEGLRTWYPFRCYQERPLKGKEYSKASHCEHILPGWIFMQIKEKIK